MLLAIFIVIAAVLLSLQLQLSVEAAYDGRAVWQGTISVGGWQLAAFPARAKKASGNAGASKMKRAWGRMLLHTVREYPSARQMLWNALRLRSVTGWVRLGASDAAKTAVLAGAVRGALALLPPAWRKNTALSITPDFFSQRTSMQVHGMFSARVGKIALCAAALSLLLLWKRMKQRRRQ